MAGEAYQLTDKIYFISISYLLYTSPIPLAKGVKVLKSDVDSLVM